jgi:tRNA/tmRNA/rRNA uracil-C5-methylase (TrmA/RlmC/RlmD family)
MRGNVVQKVPGNRFQDPGVRLKERDKVKGSKFKAGDKVEATIDSVAFGGHGVARIGEMVLFAPFTVDQDVAEIRITEIRKNYLRGKLERILVPSPWRDAPRCPYYLRCGGCQYQHISYSHQLELKKNQVIESFKRIGRIPSPPVKDVHPSPSIFNYRGKAEFHLQARRGDRPVIGFMDAGGARVVDIERCEIVDETINDALRGVREDLAASRIHAGAEETRVLWSGEGGRHEVAWGIARIVKGRTIEVSAWGFFQANMSLVDALVDAVLEMSDLTGAENILDCYCGTGLFSLFLAERARQIYAVEIDPEAVEAARRNFIAFGHPESLIFEGAVEEVLSGPLAEKKGEIDIVVLDPPRTGCDPEVMALLAEWKPRRLIYVSCDPATQARDIRFLIDRGFSLQVLQPFDMFPQTKHIEVVALLTGPR